MDLLKATAGRAALLVALAALTTCDPLVGASYRGEPVFTFQGQLMQYDDVGAQGYAFRTTVLWLTNPTFDPATDGPRLTSAVEQYSAAVALSFPGEFRVDIFAPPDDAMLIPGTGLGMALIVVYEDRDGNGRLTLDAQPGEVVGGSPDQVLIYARDATAAAAAPFESPIAAGFQLVRVPIACDGPAGTIHETTCPTPFGAPCGGDGDCGEGGTCLTELDGVTWPGGSCAVAGRITCFPPDGLAFYLGSDGVTYLIGGCDDPGDCRDGYRCDEVVRGCIPADAPLPFAPSLPRRAACDVNLGQPCIGDGDCGIGQCLVRSNGVLFPGGYCTLPIDDGVSPCEPAGGRAIEWDLTVDGADSRWFASCDADADCRVGEGYECDTFYQVCLPKVPVSLVLQADLDLPVPCNDAFGIPK